MKAELGDKRWREVKSCEEWSTTLHLSQPQCLSGFQAKWWRVKSENESSVFLWNESSVFFETRVAIFSPDISFCAWQWQEFALVKGNIVPLPGNKWNKPLYIPSGLSWWPLSDALTPHKYPQSISPHKQKNTKSPPHCSTRAARGTKSYE